MSNGTDLLRMLEPAVRPINVPGSNTAKASNPPFEKQDFDQLLKEAKQITQPNAAILQGQAGQANESVQTRENNILSDLVRIDSVENASLRNILNTKHSNNQ